MNLSTKNAKVLVLHASVGEGHRSAARAVAAALKEADPNASVDCVDALSFAHPLFRKVYSGGYVALLQDAPRLVGGLYRLFDKNHSGHGALDRARLIFERAGLGRFIRFLKEGRWDIIVNTHFLPAEIIADLRARGELSTPQATVTTDFMTHRLWVHEPCEHYFAATNEGRRHLEFLGVPSKNVMVSGIPIRPEFHSNGEEPNERPSVLVIGGGLGLGPMAEVYQALLRVDIPLLVRAVAGRNEAARKKLERVPVPPRHKSEIHGFTEDMPRLMKGSDLIVTKPGGLSVSEALASGAAILIVNPFPGQEDFNADFISKHEAGITVHKVSSLTAEVSFLLKNRKQLEFLKKNSHNLSKPHAAKYIALRILGLATSLSQRS